MYKVTLFDCNMPGFASGTVSYYCDDIDVFEEEWRQLERSEETIERFRRSKAGEIVTDYYNDDPELNIVQKGNLYQCYYEKDVELRNQTVRVHNIYRWYQDYYIHSAHIYLRYVYTHGQYLLLAKFRIDGICMEDIFIPGAFTVVECYGNPILKCSIDDDREPTEDKDAFKEDHIESIAYLVVKRFQSLKEVYDDYKNRECMGMTEEELDKLFRDIPGEAG